MAHVLAPGPVLPGATIGILGGGQLGRMTAMAARAMGYDVHVLDPDPACAARPLASRVVTAPFDDADAAADLARGCAVVTLEIEQIAATAMEAVARHAPLRPHAEAVWVVQDRVRQKEWLNEHGFPVGAFVRAEREEDVADAVGAMGPSIVKAAHGGYDGRGQAHVADLDDAGAAWEAVGGRRSVVEQRLDLAYEFSVLVARAPGGQMAVYPPAHNHHARGVLVWSALPGAAWEAVGGRRSVVEQRLDLAYEFSVLVARGPGGQMAVYPPAHNHHARGVLVWSALPGAVDREVGRAGAEIALGIAEGLEVEGLLAVECFVTADGRVLVNELAPRPHNSYHASERSSATSQFEQLVRATCGLPLGSPAPVGAGAIANLLGDVWLAGAEPDAAAALAVPTARLHLYGKRDARPGRKMGHLSAVGATPAEALARVQDAYDRFRPPAVPPIARA